MLDNDSSNSIGLLNIIKCVSNSYILGTTLGFREQDQIMVDKDYAQATEDLFNLFGERIPKFWLHVPFLYNLSSLKRKENKLTGVTKRVINGVIFFFCYLLALACGFARLYLSEFYW